MSTRTILDRYQTSASYLARILLRFSGLLLTVYMLTYIWELSTVIRTSDEPAGTAAAAFNTAMAAYNTTFWHITHAVVVALVVLHALAGLRVLSLEAGFGARFQRASFWLSLVLTVALFVLLFIKIIANLAA